jgi:hypothetical protein
MSGHRIAVGVCQSTITGGVNCERLGDLSATPQQWRGLLGLNQYAEAVMALATVQGFPQYEEQGRILQDWALAEQAGDTSGFDPADLKEAQALLDAFA